MLKVIFSKFSNDRCPEYAIRTNILRDENNTKYIEKCPMSEKAKAHIARMYDNEKKLAEQYADTILEPNRLLKKDDTDVFEFVEGVSLTQKLDMLWEQNQTKAFFELFDKLASMIEKVSKDVCNIDLIPDNIITQKERWVVIDYEWVFDEQIPARFILYRALYYYLISSKALNGQEDTDNLYNHFGFAEDEKAKWAEKEEAFQRFVDGTFSKLATFKYLHNKMTLDMNELVKKAAVREEFTCLYEFLKTDTEGKIVTDGEETETVTVSPYGELLLELPLQKGDEKIKISMPKQAACVHIRRILGHNAKGEEQALNYETNGTPLEDNVMRLVDGEHITVLLNGEDFERVTVLLGILEFTGELRQSFIRQLDTAQKENAAYLKELEEAKKQKEAYENLLKIVELRQEQILQLRDTKSIYYLGRLMNKLKHHDPVMALRPPLDVLESGIQFFVDEVQYRDYSLFVRGWAFHNAGYKVSVRVRDEKGRRIDTYVRNVVRDDVASAHGIKKEQVLGYAMTIDARQIKTEKIYLEFETVGGYISKEIMAYGRKKDRKIRESLLQNREEYQVEYDEWARYAKATQKELKKQRKTKFSYRPLISVVVPLFNTPLDYLEVMIQSVLNQTYSNMQLCLADGSTEDFVEEYIRTHYGNDKRVKYQRLTENKGISGNTIEAVKLADGEFLMLCDHDDEVMLDACYEMVKALNKDREIDAVYTDEDKMTMDGQYFFDPHFKPDFNLEFLRSNNYICHIFLIRKSIVDSFSETFRSQFDGAQDFDFILRCCEKARKVYHVPKVVYHWRSHPLSTAGNPESKDYAYEAGRASVAASYERAGIAAKVTRTKYFGRYRTEFEIVGNPKVSVIVAATEEGLEKDTLAACIRSIYEKTEDVDFDVTVVCDKKRTDLCDEVQKAKAQYKSVTLIEAAEGLNHPKAYDLGEKQAAGDYLLFVDAYVKADEKNWMKELLSYCQQKDIGVSGGRILKSDDTIWAAGMVVGMYGSVGRAFSGLDKDAFSYAGWANSTRDVSALSGVCMMADKAVYEKLSGFDEQMGEAFYDSDFCLRAIQAGKRVVYDAYSTVCYTNECENAKDSQTGLTLFKQRWDSYFVKGDPYYNPNLSKSRSDCALSEKVGRV